MISTKLKNPKVMKYFQIGIIVILTLILLPACSSPTPASPTPPPLADELVLYNWDGDISQTILDAFTAEYGVEITYLTYEEQDEAMANIRSGELYDVVVLDNDAIPNMITDGLLAEIDYQHVPNFKNIAANFRDLAYDPGNQHSIPYSWGTTALIVRSDLVEEPVTRWVDLWDPRYAGKIALRACDRETIAVALKSLGFSINSENPRELQAAEARLLELNDAVSFVDDLAEDAISGLVTGENFILVGWAEDGLLAQEEHDSITYLLPEEGAFLWGDNFVIPANSPNKYTAEIFLDFLLRAEISAQIVNENYYATANQAAGPLIDPEIRNSVIIYPPDDSLRNAEIFLPKSAEGESLYLEICEHFENAVGQ